MSLNEYEYNYHNLAEEADYIEEDSTNTVNELSDSYYDDGIDEPWMNQEDIDWDNYYHNITEEIIDD